MAPDDEDDSNDGNGNGGNGGIGGGNGGGDTGDTGDTGFGEDPEDPESAAASAAAADAAEDESLVPLGAVLEEIQKRTALTASETAHDVLKRARTPPSALDAERAVLGALLLEPSSYEHVIDEGLRPEHFYRPAHGTVFRAIQDLHAAAESIDTLTVVDELLRRGQLDAVGGSAAIAQLEALLPTAAHVQAYARLVREKATLRMLIETATNIVQSAYRQDKRVVEVIDEAERDILAISESHTKKGIVPMRELVDRATKQLEKAFNNKSAITGVACGFRDLDQLTSGFQPGELIVVAARPSMGKCLAFDSELVLEDGSVATIEELYRRRSARLLTLDEPSMKLAWTSPSAFVDDGIKLVFRVTTRLGRVIETTASHPFLTQQGWRRLDQLQPGATVAVPRLIRVNAHETASESALDELAREVAIVSHSTLPAAVFRLANRVVAALLAKIFARGSERHTSDGVERAVVVGNPRLARQLQHLLLRVGTVAAVTEGEGGATALVARTEADGAKHDVLFDEVVSIESAGMKQVYDLTVDGTHNFVANDICVHNTAFTLNVASHVATRLSKPVMFFSLEMGADQLVQRLIGSEARIDISNIRRGFIQRHEWSKLAEAAGRLSEAPFFIDETPSISVAEMRNKCRRQMHETGISVAIVDYLQLMQGPPGYDNKASEVGEISKGLKTIARELNIPVIALSQLNRGVESRTDKRPMMSDLRESGAIEQDADVIAFLYREEYYAKEKTPEDKLGIAEIIVAKHRNGPVGTVELRFFNNITRFDNLDRTHDEYTG